MESCTYIEDYDKIYSIAFVLYDHFNRSEENIKISTLMVDNVLTCNANNYFERAIIAIVSYFIDNGFNVGITSNQLDDPNLAPAIPANWRDTTTNVIHQITGQERRSATFFVRRKTQTFELSFSSSCFIGSASGSVCVALVHCGNHRGFSIGLHSSEVDGLADADRGSALAFGSHVLKKLSKGMNGPVKRAANDQAPSTPASPI